MPLAINGSGTITQTTYNSGINLSIGRAQDSPAISAIQIKQLTNTTTNGLYWILVNGVARQVYCDMNVLGGGWMLYACKVTYNFNPFYSTSLTSTHMSTINADTTGKIPDSFRGNWTQLMWRFADVTNKPYVTVYNKLDDTGANRLTWNNWLENPTTDNQAQSIGGFRKSTDGGSTFSVNYGMATTNNYFYYSNSNSSGGMSQAHDGSDQYLDLWNTVDPSNNYSGNDGANSVGTKCIAGYCYLTEPVFYMFR